VSNDGTKWEPWKAIPSRGSWALVYATDIGLVIQKWDNEKEIDVYVAKNKFGNKDVRFTLKPDFGACKFERLSDNIFGDV
jgi:hypothetical protein